MEKKRRYWKYFIYLFCGLMLIVPYSETFVSIDELHGEWMKNYTLNTFEYSIFIIPIILLLVLIPRIEKKIAKKILIGILCILSSISFLFGFQSIALPIQDFIPQWGILLLLILFPIVIIESSIEWKRGT